MSRNKPLDVEAVYMEPLALIFLRAFPGVPESLRPVYSRFYVNGLIASDGRGAPDLELTPDPWPGGLHLTEAGRRLKEIADGQSYNFFTVRQIKDILPSGQIEEVEQRIFKDRLPGHYTGFAPYREPLGLLAAMAKLGAALDGLSDATANRAK